MKFLANFLCVIGMVCPIYSSQNKENVLYTCNGKPVEPKDDKVQLLINGNTNFTLKEQTSEINCPPSTSSYNLTLNTTAEGNTPIEINTDGTLVVKNDKGLYYIRKPKDYCVISYKVEEKILNLRVCRPNCAAGSKNKCFQKCCSEKEVLTVKKDGEKLYCHSMSKKESKVKISWDMILDDNNVTIQDLSSFPKGNNRFSMDRKFFSFVVPPPNFNGSYQKNLNRTQFFLLNNFQVAFCYHTMWDVFKMDSIGFCVDEVQNEERASDTILFAILIQNSSDHFHEKITQLPEETKRAVEDFQIIYYIFCPMSLFFLLITIIVYGLLWENHKNIHGLTIISYIITLLLDYISWMCIPLESILEDAEYPWADHANLFFSCSTLCWLTIINFDIWITFSLPTNKLIGRYLIYASFAWIVPLLVVLGVVLENKNSNDSAKDVNTCPPPYSNALPSNLSQFISRIFNQFLITGIVLAFNFVFFANTIYQMWSENKKNNIALQDSAHRKNSMVWLCAKLFVVMGGVWILDTLPIMILYYVFWNGQEHIAVDVGKDLRLFLRKLIYCEWFTEFVSVIEAFTLFYIFVCKENILSQLWDKYPRLRSFLFCLMKLIGFFKGPHEGQGQELNSNITLSRKFSLSSNY